MLTTSKIQSSTFVMMAGRVELREGSSDPHGRNPAENLELMRADAETPLVAVDQLAEDNRNAVFLNAQTSCVRRRFKLSKKSRG